MYVCALFGQLRSVTIKTSLDRTHTIPMVEKAYLSTDHVVCAGFQ